VVFCSPKAPPGAVQILPVLLAFSICNCMCLDVMDHCLGQIANTLMIVVFVLQDAKCIVSRLGQLDLLGVLARM
jgi:hypothetical protein